MNMKHENCTEVCTKHARAAHISPRWILTKEDGSEIIAYGDASLIGELQTKHGALKARRAGHFQRCTGTVEGATDLCDYRDPSQYLPMQSHNQPHKGK